MCSGQKVFFFRDISVAPLKNVWHGSNSQTLLTTSVSMVVDSASTCINVMVSLKE